MVEGVWGVKARKILRKNTTSSTHKGNGFALETPHALGGTNGQQPPEGTLQLSTKENVLTACRCIKMEDGAGEGSGWCFDGRVYKGLKQWQVLIFYTAGGGLKGGSLLEEGILRDMSQSYNKMYKEFIFIWGGMGHKTMAPEWGTFSEGILFKSK